MSALVYQAINAVSADLAENGIAKGHTNDAGGYRYRSIDDVLNALSPLLVRHRLCVLSRILSRDSERLACGATHVNVSVAFDLVSALDGSVHTIGGAGEALDESDKGTAKAMSAAYKSAMLQAFCIPVAQEEANAAPMRVRPSASTGAALSEPPEGWDSWAGEVTAIATSCETPEAIERLLTIRRSGLAALQRSRPDLYGNIGEAVAGRLNVIQSSVEGPLPDPGRKVGSRKRKERQNGSAKAAEAA